VRQQHGGTQELAAPTVVPPRCALVAGEGRVRRPDGRVSSILPLSAGWPVHPDPLPSCVAHRVSRSVLECVCGVICEIVTTWPTSRFGPYRPPRERSKSNASKHVVLDMQFPDIVLDM